MKYQIIEHDMVWGGRELLPKIYTTFQEAERETQWLEEKYGNDENQVGCKYEIVEVE